MAFNRLSAAQAERLAFLSEELGEVQQAIGKILRHGYASVDPTKAVRNQITNRRALEKELGDLCAALDLMEHERDINAKTVAARRIDKLRSVKRWMHHQPKAKP